MWLPKAILSGNSGGFTFETQLFVCCLSNKGCDPINILTVLLALLIFGFLIFIHEMGHYLTARLFKVKILEYSIGMGPKLLSRTSEKTGTAYSLRAFPIGGFVSMEGEDEDSPDENSFRSKPVWQRIIITSAGALTNLLVGVLVMGILMAAEPVLLPPSSGLSPTARRGSATRNLPACGWGIRSSPSTVLPPTSPTRWSTRSCARAWNRSTSR